MKIVVEGLSELRARYQKAPQRFKNAMRSTMAAALLVLQENIPPYPKQRENSSYRRTGTLGRSLGADMTGNPTGAKPDIYSISERSGYTVGEFGSRVEYAPHVIGETEQWPLFKRLGWWTIAIVAKRASQKIGQVFQIMAEELAKWLDENP